MAKKPVPGRSKTRLTPHLDEDAAAELSRSMIADTVAALASRRDCETFIAADSEDAASWFVDEFPSLPVLVQRGEKLGDRLHGVLEDLLSTGFAHVFALGSDSPDLPGAHLTTAFTLLGDDATDLVFGPTEDGGYYLIGWKQPWTSVLVDVEMSTPSVLEDSLKVAAAIDARVALAPSWYDIDDIGDLDRLRGNLADEANAPKTAAFLGVSRS